MTQEQKSSRFEEAAIQETRRWAVERAIEIRPRAPGVTSAQRRADVIATAKALEAYVTGKVEV